MNVCLSVDVVGWRKDDGNLGCIVSGGDSDLNWGFLQSGSSSSRTLRQIFFGLMDNFKRREF